MKCLVCRVDEVIILHQLGLVLDMVAGGKCKRKLILKNWDIKKINITVGQVTKIFGCRGFPPIKE